MRADISSAETGAISARFGSRAGIARPRSLGRERLGCEIGVQSPPPERLRNMTPDPKTDGSASVSQLLAAWAARDPRALDRLVPLVYDELRRLARYHMNGERAGHTLQTTALVNEVYLRLAGIKGLQWRDRAHFFAMAGTLMRRVLVDYARRQRRGKRGGGVTVTSLDGHDVTSAPSVDGVDLEALDDALHRLAGVDPQQCRVVELRFFGGLSIEETAEALGISPATVKRDWTTAKTWLHHELATR
jgi:RNA polymerase sigma factor (TIGR02999 family)